MIKPCSQLSHCTTDDSRVNLKKKKKSSRFYYSWKKCNPPLSTFHHKSKGRHNHGPPPTCIPDPRARAYNNKHLSENSASETSAIRRRRLIFPERGQLDERDHRAIFQLENKKKKVFFPREFSSEIGVSSRWMQALMFAAAGMLLVIYDSRCTR